jgi:UDP-N-acetylglucosamine 2-epimerase (non-hydrolysing)
MKVMSIFGIRPDWSKGCTVLDALDRQRGIEHVIAHTGQHYSYNLDKIFFDQLGIRKPDVNLDVGSGSQGQQMARIIERSEAAILKEKPDIVLVLGDSNSSLAALAAAKLNVKVAHIESGMRSFDWRMPEEKNKRIIDHISWFLFAYTYFQRENLLLERINYRKVFVTGNPSSDVIGKFVNRASESGILDRLGVSEKEYFLVTCHRAENVDDAVELGKILRALALVIRKFKKKIVWPLYPRTRKSIKKFGYSVPQGVIVTEPLGFMEFLALEKYAACAITDSGTVQEECCILNVPCVTIRMSTERPETIELGSNIIAGTDPKRIVSAVEKMVESPTGWRHPYGENVSAKMVGVMKRYKPKHFLQEMRDEISDERIRIHFAGSVTEGWNN